MASPTNNIEIELDQGVQTIRFARPDKKNAITPAMYQAMANALLSGDQAEDVRVHLFVGSSGIFTAGNDIQDFLAASSDGHFGMAAMCFLECLIRAEKPLVAAVNGAAIGIGTTLLFHMDLVYAGVEATFRTPFLDLGLVPEGGSSLLMPARMGHPRAFEMLCMGKEIDSTAAREAGIVNEVLPTGEVEKHAHNAALELAGKPPEALRTGRRLMRGDSAELIKHLREEAKIFMERLQSAEAKEAFMAFLEKRPANFR